MNILAPIFYLLLSISAPSPSGQPPPGNLEAAYRSHYRGSIQYGKGNFQKANNYFQKAYDIDPHNPSFAFSLAVSLGRTGQIDDGLNVLRIGTGNLKKQDPEYQQKLAKAHFFEGMIHVFGQRFGSAIQAFRNSISIQKELDDPETLSIIHNAVGYAIVMDQGSGAHRRADLAPHLHVHQRDFLRAMEYFEASLLQDGSNPAAQYNYHKLCDSLEIAPRITYDTMGPVKRFNAPTGSSFFLPSNVMRAIEFAQYEEVLLLLDISGSMVMEKVTCMDTTRFMVMKETAAFVLDNLAPTTRVGIATIGGDCNTVPKLWESVGKLSLKDLKQTVDFLYPHGTTPLLERLKQSPELFSDSLTAQKAIFLISDGANVCSDPGGGICEWAKDLSKRNVTINVMTFLDATLNHINAFAEYTCLADNTKGKILYMDNLNCSLEYYTPDLVKDCHLYLPDFRRVSCWGPSVKNLWAIFPED